MESAAFARDTAGAMPAVESEFLRAFRAGFEQGNRAWNEGDVKTAYATLPDQLEYRLAPTWQEARVLRSRDEVIQFFEAFQATFPDAHTASHEYVEGIIGLKSHAGRRKVPIAAVLRDYLDEHRLQCGGEGRVFDFNPGRLTQRADRARKEAKLDRITLHECRHTFASLMIAAGVNTKALSTYMGHANIGITLDPYGHLMPGNGEEAAELLDAYLAAWDARARPGETTPATVTA